MTDIDRLTDVRARTAAAAEGPWTVQGYGRVWAGSLPGGYAVADAMPGTMPTGSEEECYRNADFLAASREDVPWLCDFAVSLMGHLADMQADQGYRRGFADGVRRALEEIGRDVLYIESTASLRITSRLAALGPSDAPLPPDALLAGYEKMKEAVEKVLYETRVVDLHPDNKVMHCERITREALGK